MPVKILGFPGYITVKRGETGLPMEMVALGVKGGCPGRVEKVAQAILQAISFG